MHEQSACRILQDPPSYKLGPSDHFKSRFSSVLFAALKSRAMAISGRKSTMIYTHSAVSIQSNDCRINQMILYTFCSHFIYILQSLINQTIGASKFCRYTVHTQAEYVEKKRHHSGVEVMISVRCTVSR